LLNHKVTKLEDLPPQIHANLYTVTPNKCYNFIFYHAHRKKRPTSRRPASANDVYFGPAELAEYRQIIELYGGAQSNPPDPSNCLGFSQLNVYKATVYMFIWSRRHAAVVRVRGTIATTMG